MLSNEKIKASQIKIADRVLDVTLLVLGMHYFEVILGMDRLSANHTSIDYSRKKVLFNSLAEASFKYKGVGAIVLPKVISAMKT